jgi:ABC-type nitrate/sulfonate/bicarbonate transport system substrate-binding protein
MTRTTDSSSASESLWYTRSPVPTPLGIAVHLGWLNGELSADGVAIRSLHESGRHDRSSLSDHTLEMSFRQGGSIPAMWARSHRADTRVIGLSWVDESQQILTLPDSGIRSVRELRGRRIGIPRRQDDRIDIFRASALRGVSNALSLEGLGTQDVELIEIAARTLQTVPDERGAELFTVPLGLSSRSLYVAEASALLRGTVDAIYVKGSTGLELAQLIGARTVIDIGFHPEPSVRNNNGTPRPLTVNAEVLANHPDIVAGFLKLVIAAGDWARSHPDETAAYVAQETASSVDWVRAAYGADLHHRLDVNLDAGSIAALTDFKNFLHTWGFLDDDFEIANWIDPRPMADALASSVRRRA